MIKNKSLVAGLALTVLAFGASVASYADFVDHFSNGSVANSDTIRKFWFQHGYYDNEKVDRPSKVTERIGGPLKLTYSGDWKVQGGPRLFSRFSPEFDFFSHPVSLTISAPPNGTLTPVKDVPAGNSTSLVCGAWTFFGLNAKCG